MEVKSQKQYQFECKKNIMRRHINNSFENLIKTRYFMICNSVNQEIAFSLLYEMSWKHNEHQLSVNGKLHPDEQKQDDKSGRYNQRWSDNLFLVSGTSLSRVSFKSSFWEQMHAAVSDGILSFIVFISFAFWLFLQLRPI